MPAYVYPTIWLFLVSLPATHAFALAGQSERQSHDEAQLALVKRLASEADNNSIRHFTAPPVAEKLAALKALRAKQPVQLAIAAKPPDIGLTYLSFEGFCTLCFIMGSPFIVIALCLYLTWSCLRARDREIANLRRRIQRGICNSFTKAARVLQIQSRFSDILARRPEDDQGIVAQDAAHALASQHAPVPLKLEVKYPLVRQPQMAIILFNSLRRVS